MCCHWYDGVVLPCRLRRWYVAGCTERQQFTKWVLTHCYWVKNFLHDHICSLCWMALIGVAQRSDNRLQIDGFYKPHRRVSLAVSIECCERFWHSISIEAVETDWWPTFISSMSSLTWYCQVALLLVIRTLFLPFEAAIVDAIEKYHMFKNRPAIIFKTVGAHIKAFPVLKEVTLVFVLYWLKRNDPFDFSRRIYASCWKF